MPHASSVLIGGLAIDSHVVTTWPVHRQPMDFLKASTRSGAAHAGRCARICRAAAMPSSVWLGGIRMSAITRSGVGLVCGVDEIWCGADRRDDLLHHVHIRRGGRSNGAYGRCVNLTAEVNRQFRARSAVRAPSVTKPGLVWTKAVAPRRSARAAGISGRRRALRR